MRLSFSFSSLAFLASFALFGCAVEPSADEPSDTDESALLGRSTRQICDAVDGRWGSSGSSGENLENATDAFACANRQFWSTRYTPAGVHQKFYVHRAICTMNPA